MAEIPSNGGSLAEGQHGASDIPVPNDGICRNSGTRVNRTGHPNTSCDDHRRRAHSGGETLQPHTSDAQIQVTHRVRDTAMVIRGRRHLSVRDKGGLATRDGPHLPPLCKIQVGNAHWTRRL
jgi:hypothetical protein